MPTEQTWHQQTVLDAKIVDLLLSDMSKQELIQYAAFCGVPFRVMELRAVAAKKNVTLGYWPTIKEA